MKSASTYVAEAGTDLEIPRGSVAVGDRLPLPAGADEPIAVYMNGVEQRREVDYEIAEGEVVFARPILKESNLGISRWMALYLGIFGTYRIHESIDIHYVRGGSVAVVDDAKFPGEDDIRRGRQG